ncbi:MAG TPA: thioesterase family protein [Myxococcota bacterium]|nr:thioesterase family protein [Myxococcota bacterium]
MPRSQPGPPAGAGISVVVHRVPFYETDAMGIVHHSNSIRHMELARILWLDEHHRPYRDYVAEGLHFATTRVEVDYRRPAAYDDSIEIATWLEWVRGASLRMAYEIRRGDAVVSRAATEHAVVDLEGRLRRIPRERRAAKDRF